MSDLAITLAAITGSELRAEVLGSGALPNELPITVDSDGSVDAAAQPRSPAVATVGFELQVDGVPISLTAATGSWSITRSLDQRLQTWQIEFALKDAAGQFGSPFVANGPALCRKSVTIYGVYRTATGEHRVPLIVDGIADMTVRTVRAGEVPLEGFTGVDRGGRHDRRKVTLVLLPGHGLTRAEVVAKLAQAAEVPSIRVEPVAGARRCTKEVQVVDGDWAYVAADMLTVEGRSLLWDRDGALVARSGSRKEEGEPVAWSFDERDFDGAAGVSIEHTSDVLTDVTLTTWEQLPVPECLPEGSQVETEITGIRDPKAQAFRQHASASIPPDWTFDALPPPSEEERPRTLAITRVERVKRCGVLLWERVRTWEWRNWLVPRLVWGQVAITPASEFGPKPLACYVNDSDEGFDGQSEGMIGAENRFSLVSQIEVWHYYNWIGYTIGTHPVAVGPGPGFVGDVLWGMFAHLGGNKNAGGGVGTGGVGTAGPALAGSYLGTITATAAPKWIECAIREVGHDEDTYGPVADGTRLTAGAGHGIAPTDLDIPYGIVSPYATRILHTPYSSQFGGPLYYEAMRPASVEVKAVYDDNESGIVSRERSVTFGYGLRPGGRYVYSDGAAYATATEEFQRLVTEETVYEATGEASHEATTTTRGHDGRVLVTREEREGAGPSVPRLDLPEVDEAIYAGLDEEAKPILTRRGATRQIEARVHADGLEVCHPKGELTTSVEWAETEEELIAVGERLIADSAAARVSATLAGCNFFCEPGQVQRWTVRAAGLDHDIRVRSVTWRGEGLRIVTTIEGLAHGW